MRDAATLFAIQWAGLVAQVELVGIHGPQSTLVEHEDMVGSAVPSVPSSLINVALARDPDEPPHELEYVRRYFKAAGAPKWGVWVPGGDDAGSAAARGAGLRLDSTPAAMVAELDMVEVERTERPDLATVGAINDAAYGFPAPRLAPAIAGFPEAVHTYGALADDGAIGAVAMAFDHGHEDTAVWYVATRPEAQRQGLARRVMRGLLAEARARGSRTASLQSSAAGQRLYESLGFAVVGEVHLYEEQLR
jgi:ribosomal protein S18 acetylase RimI-like enzyme